MGALSGRALIGAGAVSLTVRLAKRCKYLYLWDRGPLKDNGPVCVFVHRARTRLVEGPLAGLGRTPSPLVPEAGRRTGTVRPGRRARVVKNRLRLTKTAKICLRNRDNRILRLTCVSP